jgi:hypothetical protein
VVEDGDKEGGSFATASLLSTSLNIFSLPRTTECWILLNLTSPKRFNISSLTSSTWIAISNLVLESPKDGFFSLQGAITKLN